MEGLKLRAFVLSAVFLATGGFVAISAKPTSTGGKTEAWMKKTAISEMGKYRSRSSAEDPEVSYVMPKSTYDTLVPYGIVARDFDADGQGYDVVLIASRNRASFHDPRVCFTAQGYTILTEDQVSIPTKTRGDIPATLAQMDGPNGKSVAVFFYRGPRGFYGTTMGLKIALLKDQLFGNTNLDGVFYRFIPIGDASTDRLLDFIGKYMDESGKHSGGYF